MTIRTAIGFFAAFAVFEWTAQALGSDRGQAGLIVGAFVVSATLGIERILFGRSWVAALTALGLGRPLAGGVAVATAACVLLLMTALLFVQVTGTRVTLVERAHFLFPGLFAQAGMAEEVLFRGYLFGHLRSGRSFWRAAWLSMLPFLTVHLLLFRSMPWPVAASALLLAIVLAFPLAHLFELGGRTIWAPALVHFVVQGTVKVLVVSGEASPLFPVVWMASSAVIPMCAFLVSRPSGLSMIGSGQSSPNSRG